MSDRFTQTLIVAARLREELGITPSVSFDPVHHLESAYPVACVVIPGLCVRAIRRWLEQRVEAFPAQLLLAEQEDRPLHGAVLAWRGVGLLLADEYDPWVEQRYTFAHEGAHFFLEHYLLRQEALRCLGERIRPVLDGKRSPTLEERADALLRNTAITWHTHLFPKSAQGRRMAEDRADWLACGLLAPPTDIDPRNASPQEIADKFNIPSLIAEAYLRLLLQKSTLPSRSPVLERLRLYTMS